VLRQSLPAFPVWADGKCAERGNSSTENYTPEARATTRNACCPEAEQAASDEKLGVELKK